MNLALSDEQVLLREAARGALSRFKTLEEAREALDRGGEAGGLSDLWPTAKEAAWTYSTRCSCSASAGACSPRCHCSAICPPPRS
jgi:hypothetical protein